jgi:hypothetical protein
MDREDKDVLYNPIDYFLKGTMIVLVLVYILARTYLVVECFIQLLLLQPGLVFVQPSWSTYFQHLG